MKPVMKPDYEVYVVVTVSPHHGLEVEVLDSPPQWTPANGQWFFVANINGGDSADITPERNTP